MSDAPFVHVEHPCHVSWAELSGGERERMCAQCDTNVHNLSILTSAQVQELFVRSPSICIRYKVNAQGTPLLLDTPDPWWRLELQWQGAQKLAKAAIVALPMFLAAACDAPQPKATPPMIIIEGDEVRMSSHAHQQVAQRYKGSGMTYGAPYIHAPVRTQTSNQTKPSTEKEDSIFDIDFDIASIRRSARRSIHDFFDFKKYTADVAGIRSGPRKSKH